MAHQLYVLQVLTFNLLEERMMTKMDPNDQVKKMNVLFDMSMAYIFLSCLSLTNIIRKFKPIPFRCNERSMVSITSLLNNDQMAIFFIFAAIFFKMSLFYADNVFSSLGFRPRETSFSSCVGLLSMEKMTPLVQKRERPCTPRTIRCWGSL